MKYFFLFTDYLIAILLLISPIYWKRIANSKLNKLSGYRTKKSMKDQKSWKKAQLLASKYSTRIGFVLIIFITLIRWRSPFVEEVNSLIISIISIISLILIIPLVDRELK